MFTLLSDIDTLLKDAGRNLWAKLWVRYIVLTTAIVFGTIFGVLPIVFLTRSSPSASLSVLLLFCGVVAFIWAIGQLLRLIRKPK